MNDSMIDFIVAPFTFIFKSFFSIIVIIWFGVGWALPRIWISGEKMGWGWFLGNSTASQLIISYLETDFYLLIKQKEMDDGSPRPLAVLQAIWIRVKEIFVFKANGELLEIKNLKVEKILESAIKNLNEGWRRGIPHDILEKYIKIIEDSSYDKSLSVDLRMRALCSVAVVKYALGDIKEGLALGKRNWNEAEQMQESEKKTEYLFMSAYAYIYATMFAGHPSRAMDLMADIWNKYFAFESKESKKAIKTKLNEKLILNTVLSIPRHIILAATFKEPKFDEKYFPNKNSYLNYLQEKDQDSIENEILWVKAWYEEAKNICTRDFDKEGISLDLSHAYTIFYLSLLLQDVEDNAKLRSYLCNEIEKAFVAIDESAPIPSRYAKYGFYGVYQLICGNDKGALNSLRQAATYSSISGNRFADCIFQCCHALAAMRLSSKMDECLAPEIDYYLKETHKLAKKIGGNFYPALYAAAYSAICELRGNKGEAKRYFVKSNQGNVGKRILKVFHNCN